MRALFLFAAFAVGCSGSVEPTSELPPTCRVEAEYIRLQLCPTRPVLINCGDVSTPNVAPGHCDGPLLDGKAETGNAWCCDSTQRLRCDNGWARCVESGLAMECVSNGAEALCTCQGTFDGHLVALACYQ